MTHLIRKTLVAAALLFLVAPRPAAAESLTIGHFLYDTDSTFGPFFTVENFSDSGGTFTNMVLSLYSGATDVKDLTLVVDPSLTFQSLDAGGTFQTIDALSQFTFDRAVLALTFSLPGTLDVAPLTGLTFDLDATDPDNPVFFGNSQNTFISFSPEEQPPSQSVPEPSTLLLMACGVALVAFRQRLIQPGFAGRHFPRQGT